MLKKSWFFENRKVVKNQAIFQNKIKIHFRCFASINIHFNFDKVHWFLTKLTHVSCSRDLTIEIDSKLQNGVTGSTKRIGNFGSLEENFSPLWSKVNCARNRFSNKLLKIIVQIKKHMMPMRMNLAILLI